MRLRGPLLAALGLGLAVLLSVLLLDRPLALWLAAQPGLKELGAAITGVYELAFGLKLSKYLLVGLLAAAAALVALADRGLRRAGGLLVLAASVQLSRVLTGSLKGLFERVRPYDYAAAPAEQAQDFFVAGAHSFPSGHAAFYFGLLVPAALLWPRLRLPALLLGALGASGRVLQGDHYVGDVLASALVALLVALPLIALLRWRLPAPETDR